MKGLGVRVPRRALQEIPAKEAVALSQNPGCARLVEDTLADDGSAKWWLNRAPADERPAPRRPAPRRQDPRRAPAGGRGWSSGGGHERRAAARGVWRVQRGRPGRSNRQHLQITPIDTPMVDRGVLCMWGMPHTPRSGRRAPIGMLCMLPGAATDPGRMPPHPRVPAVDDRSPTDTSRRGGPKTTPRDQRCITTYPSSATATYFVANPTRRVPDPRARRRRAAAPRVW